MKTEREIYLKPLTLREQVAMEQGICSASILVGPKSGVTVTKHETGFDGTYDVEDPDNSDFAMGEWN